MSTPRIKCAVCQRLVDRVEWWDEHATRTRVVAAHCHGAVDQMRIDLVQPAHMRPELIEALAQSEGLAFGPARDAGQLLAVEEAAEVSPAAWQKLSVRSNAR